MSADSFDTAPYADPVATGDTSGNGKWINPITDQINQMITGVKAMTDLKQAFSSWTGSGVIDSASVGGLPTAQAKYSAQAGANPSGALTGWFGGYSPGPNGQAGSNTGFLVTAAVVLVAILLVMRMR